MIDDAAPEQPRGRRRHRRATHPGTSPAARSASTERDDAAARQRPRRPQAETAADEREQWLLDERPPHWG